MSQPMRFKTVGKENMECKLKKLLHELKQSPRQWYKRFNSIIRGKRYTLSHYDQCVYYNKLPSGEYIYLLGSGTSIDVRFHFIREILDEGDIELLKVHTKENPADMLIKAILGVKFRHCKEMLHILPVA